MHTEPRLEIISKPHTLARTIMALEQAWVFLKAQAADDGWCNDCAGSGVATTGALCECPAGQARSGLTATGTGAAGAITSGDLEAAAGAREAATRAREAAATARQQAGPDGLSPDGKYYSGPMPMPKTPDTSTWQPGRDINEEVDRILEENRRRREEEE